MYNAIIKQFIIHTLLVKGLKPYVREQNSDVREEGPTERVTLADSERE